MKTLKQFTLATAVVLTLGLAGCGTMSEQTRNTAIGAGVGGVAGNVITGGSTLGTVGGAAVGGAVGHSVKTDK